MNYTVKIYHNKDDWDSKLFSEESKQLYHWLFDNIGKFREDWNTTLHEEEPFHEIWKFNTSQNAALFALRWA